MSRKVESILQDPQDPQDPPDTEITPAEPTAEEGGADSGKESSGGFFNE